MSRHTRAYYDRTARTFRKNRYLFVKELLPTALLEYLKIYYRVLFENELFTRDSQCPTSLSLGGDPGLDSVLEWVRPEIGRLVGFELAPTYSYTRRYAKGELLKRHIDRSSCEVSVTVSSTPEPKSSIGGIASGSMDISSFFCISFPNQVRTFRITFTTAATSSAALVQPPKKRRDIG